MLRKRSVVIVSSIVVVLGLAVVGLSYPSWKGLVRHESQPRSLAGATSTVNDSPTAVPSVPAPPRDWVKDENRKPGTTEWYVPMKKIAPVMKLGGYTTSTSVLPGQPVTLRINNVIGPRQRVSAFRVGWYGGKGARLVARSPWQPATKQPHFVFRDKTPDGRTLNMVDASGWHDSLTMDTKGWPEGAYILMIEASATQRYPIPFMIRSASVAGRTVMVSSTTTWQSYNRFGGYSAYSGAGSWNFPTRSRWVTYDRPYDTGATDRFLAWSRAAVVRAEQSGLDLGYLTDVDLDRGGIKAYPGATTIVEPDHDEYWPTARKQWWTQMRDRGTNFVAVTGNIMWWHIRWQPSMRTFEIYKDVREDPHATLGTGTGNYTTSDMESLHGSRYTCNKLVDPLRIEEPSFWAFAGTGVVKGERLPGLIRHEPDRVYYVPGLMPENLEIAAHSPVTCYSGKIRHSDFHDLTYYTAPSGAGVLEFATAGIDYAMDTVNHDRFPEITDRSRGFATKTFQNALTEAARGPLGRVHPATFNVTKVLEADGANLSMKGQMPAPLKDGWAPTPSGADGDVTGDRFADVLAVRASAMILHPGSSAGLGTAQPTSVGWGDTNWVSQVGDINGDKAADLVSRTNSGKLLLELGLAQGQFSQVVEIGHGWQGRPLAVQRATAVQPAVLLSVDEAGALTARTITKTGTGAPTQVATGWSDVTDLLVSPVPSDPTTQMLIARHRDGSATAHPLTRGSGAAPVLGSARAFDLKVAAGSSVTAAGAIDGVHPVAVEVDADGRAKSWTIAADGSWTDPKPLSGSWSNQVLVR